MPRRASSTRAASPARPLRALLAMLALLAAIALPAHAQEAGPGEQSVVIVLPTGTQHQIPWKDVEPHAKDVRTELPGNRDVTLRAVTLEQVLNRAQMTRDKVSSIGTTRDDGAAMVISRVQLTRFYSDPLVYLDENGVLSLLRPKVIGDPAEVATAIDGRLTLTIGSQPELTAHPEVVSVGDTAEFTVTIPLDIPDPSKVTFVWDFNDDKPVVRNDRNAMQRTFSKPGFYNVTVNYEIDGRRWDESGLAPSAVLEVKPDKQASRDKHARKSDRRRASAEQGGGDDEQVDDLDAGAGAGGGTGTGSGGGGWGGDDGGFDLPAAAETTPPPAPRAKPRAERRRAETPPEPVGETVDGYLLAAADVPLPTGGAVHATAADPKPLDDDPLNIPTAVWVVLAVAGLGLLGWTLESRTTLPYFKP